MRIDGNISGLQTISPDGTKRFLSGQRNKGAVYIMDNKGIPILCEGMATALSVRRALKCNKTRYKLVVCFSAGNLSDMAKSYPDCVIVADNDPVGIKVAQGYPHWVSDIQKEDFNDAELRLGAYEAGKSLIATFPAALA
jgi:putative DNA primase/helicase